MSDGSISSEAYKVLDREWFCSKARAEQFSARLVGNAAWDVILSVARKGTASPADIAGETGYRPEVIERWVGLLSSEGVLTSQSRDSERVVEISEWGQENLQRYVDRVENTENHCAIISRLVSASKSIRDICITLTCAAFMVSVFLTPLLPYIV